jgi:hypothetical protein
MATKGTAWVLRRSTDLVPSLLAMAVMEWRAGRSPDLAAGPDIRIPGQLQAQRATAAGLGPMPLPSPNGSDPDEHGDPHLAQVADG